jgi:hypothetical protein
MKMHDGGTCENHGGELIEVKQPAPIDTTKALAPDQKATVKKTKTQTTAAVAKPKPTAPKTTSNVTARCNDGAMYHATERRGACAKHGGVRNWL